MELVIKLNSSGKTSLQNQIADKIRKLIVNTNLQRGSKLPSTRELSEQLRVSRNTVKGAYDKLLDEGYIESKHGSGTYVSSSIPELSIEKNAAHSPNLKNYLPVHLLKKSHASEKKLYRLDLTELKYDFQLERTDPESFPVKNWQRIINQKLKDAPQNMARYGEPTGLPELREAIAQRIATSRGINVEPEQIIITTGIQQGLNIVSHLFVRNGTKVVLEAPGYRGASYLFQNYGAELIPVPVDEFGVITDELPRKEIGIAFITPSRQFPLGGTLPMERRRALLNWANMSGAYIIEVDYDSDFRYEGMPSPAVKALDEQQSVIYLGSFSKSIGPGLRLGYMVMPANLIDSAKSTKLLLDYGLPWLDQIVLSEFISSGSFEKYLKRLRRLYKTRRNKIINAISDHCDPADITGRECGTHLIWKLPEGAIHAPELQKQAKKHSTGIYTLWQNSISNWEYEDDSHRFVLLGYGALQEKEISEGMEIITDILRQSS